MIPCLHKSPSCISLKHNVPSPPNGMFLYTVSVVCTPGVIQALPVPHSVSSSFPPFYRLHFYWSHSLRHLHLSFLNPHISVCSSPPSPLPSIYISYLSLHLCHINNWWHIFDLHGIVKGWLESRGQHQYWVKSTAVTYAPSACCTFIWDTLY